MNWGEKKGARRECNLIENHSKFDKPDVRHVDLQVEPVRIIIEAYNRTPDDAYKEKALNLFDSLLQDSTYKKNSIEIIKEYDRYKSYPLSYSRVYAYPYPPVDDVFISVQIHKDIY